MDKKHRSNFKRSRKPNVKDKFYTKEGIFLSRIASILQVPKAKANAIFSERTVSTIRLNTLADSAEKIYEKLENKGWMMEKVEWAPNTYIVKNADKSVLGRTEEYKKGLFYMQNLSSMLPVLVLDPQESDLILDMCAAPGSKTTMMATLMRNRGKIFAVDESYPRVQKLREVLKSFYVKNSEVVASDASRLSGTHKNHFDKVLLDAPCSGEGLIYLRAPKPLRFWNIRRISSMSSLQKKLIAAAYETVKPGGTLIYSTCTLEPAENEEVISHLLSIQPRAKLEQIDLVDKPEFEYYKPMIMKGIKHWSETDYNPEVVKCIRVIPGKRMQGFFVAKIRKT